jgi:hypothetical protein
MSRLKSRALALAATRKRMKRSFMRTITRVREEFHY